MDGQQPRVLVFRVVRHDGLEVYDVLGAGTGDVELPFLAVEQEFLRVDILMPRRGDCTLMV